jgi:uncharacterized protein DUF4232
MLHRSLPRRVAIAAGVSAVALAIPAPITAAPHAAAAAPPRCGVLSLMGELRHPTAGAGQRFVTLVLTNVTRQTCTVRGYPGLRLLDRRNNPLPTRVVPDRSRPVHLLVLAPGDTARSDLRWGAIPGPGEPAAGPCEPNPARIAVRPPHAAHRLVLPWRFGPVCERGRIDVRPLS